MKIKLLKYLLLILALLSNMLKAQKPVTSFSPGDWQKAVSVLRDGKHDNAADLFKKAIGRVPDREKIVQAGNLLKQAGAISQAEDIYLWGRKSLRDKSVYSYELGSLFQQQLRYEDAVREYSLFLKQNPEIVMIKFNELALQAGYGPIAILAERYINPGTDDGKWLIGYLLNKSDKMLQSWHYLKDLNDHQKMSTAIQMLTSRVDLDFNNAIIILEEYLSKDRPDSDKWSKKLAEYYIETGKFNKAEELLIKLADGETPAFQIQLAEYYSKYGKDPCRAVSLTSDYGKNWPDTLKYRYKFIQYRCFLAQNDLIHAQKCLYEMVEESNPIWVRQKAYYLWGELCLATEQPDSAAKMYGRVVGMQHEGEYVNDALDKILLISQIKTDKITLMPILCQALAAKSSCNYEKARKTFLALADSASGTKAGDYALSEICEIEITSGSYSNAIKWLIRLSESTDDSLVAAEAYYRRGKIYKKNFSQKSEAVECWRQGILKYPNTSWAEMMRQQIDLEKTR